MMPDRRCRWTVWVGGVLVAALFLVGTGFPTSSNGAVAGAQTSSLLGPKHPATGTPVKIGFVTDDKNDINDTSSDTPVANATTKWLNQYMNGLGGHPIKLIRCVDRSDPSAATDCANQMIADKVAAVVMGGDSVVSNVWAPLNAARIPVFTYSGSNPEIAGDTHSTFVMTNGASTLVSLPVSAAKKTHAKKVSVVAIDLPAATEYFKGPGPKEYKKNGLDLELVAIPSGTADMNSQMQSLTSGNPKGVVFVLGGDAFCIAAFNGLRAAGFKGQVTAVPFCITDNTRTAVPASFIKGIQIGSTSPIDDPKDPSMKQYYAVLDKFGAGDVDKTSLTALSMYMALSGMSVATQNLKGDATPASITAAAKAMPWSVLPGSGGMHIRCNGKADPTQPAVCTNAILSGTLNAKGKVIKYTPAGDQPIPG